MQHADGERCPVHALCPACARIARDALMANIGLEPLSAVNERAAVVAFLLSRAKYMKDDHNGVDDACWAEVALIAAARAVERGEHRHEEKP